MIQGLLETIVQPCKQPGIDYPWRSYHQIPNILTLSSEKLVHVIMGQTPNN